MLIPSTISAGTAAVLISPGTNPSYFVSVTAIKESVSIPFLLPSALRITIPSWFTGVFPLPNHSRIFGLNVILQILASDKVILHLSLFSAHSAGTNCQRPSLTTPICTYTSPLYS